MSAPLEFLQVTAGYDGRATLRDVSLALPAGAVTGLLGPNGAGKTTLLRAALGIVPVEQGRVRVLERPLASWTRGALAREIAYLPQGADAHWPVTARTLASLGRLPHRTPFAPLSDGDRRIVDEALARCDALSLADRRIDELSSGERARVLLARALATGARILMADEPAAHLDPSHQLQLMELLGEEARRGVAVVVTLHDLGLASRFCDRVVVLDRGRVASEGMPGEALTPDVLRTAFGIEAWRGGNGAGPIVPWKRIADHV